MEHTKEQLEAMRLALRTLHKVEIVGDVDVKYWPYVAKAINQARQLGVPCFSCKKKAGLTHTSVALPEGEPNRGRFFHLCKLCGETPEAVEEGRLNALNVNERFVHGLRPEEEKD